MRTALVTDLPEFPVTDPEQLEVLEQWLATGSDWDQALQASEWGVRPISGGAISDGAVLLQNTPVGAPFEINPGAFFAGTERTEHRHAQVAFAAGATWTPVELPQVGVLAKIIVQFVGTAVQATASGTTTPLWPYGLLDNVEFTGNGSDALFSCQGVSLKALEATRYPYLNSTADDLIGPGVGGGLTLNTGTTNLRLTYEIPIAMDESSLIGALFAQSSALALQLTGRDAAVARLVTNSGGTTTISGTWHVAIEYYRAPTREGKMLLPDLRFLHGFHEVAKAHSNTGEVSSPLTRTNGALQRLFVQNIKDTANPVVYYSPTSSTDVTEYRLEIHGSKKPRVYTPAQALVARNVRDYGRVLPNSFVVLDNIRYNPTRDVIHLGGLTEIQWVSNVAAPTNGQQRIVQETLFV
jgi:hypothetical protein